MMRWGASGILGMAAAFLLLAFYLPVGADDRGYRPAVWDPEVFISLDELRPGMEGLAYTVVKGTEISAFRVRIVSIIRGRGFHNRDYILGYSSGPLIDLTNGIAGGMSGSPVFIDGRLAGAVSGHWSFTDQRFTIITPIEHMLTVWDHDDPRFAPFEATPIEEAVFRVKGQSFTPLEESTAALGEGSSGIRMPSAYRLDPPVVVGGRLISRLIIPQTPSQERLAKMLADPQTEVVELAEVPLVVAGVPAEVGPIFTRAVKSFLPEDFTLYGGVVGRFEVRGGDLTGGRLPQPDLAVSDGFEADFMDLLPPNATPPAEIRPGAVITTPYMRGDIQSYSYGTFTYLDRNGNFLAYGHPSSRGGAVERPVGTGYVYNVPPNLRRVGKLALQGKVIGTTLQDRGPAIAGVLGKVPKFVELTIRVEDQQTGQLRTLHTQVAREKNLMPGMIFAAVQTALVMTTTNQGRATVRYFQNVDFEGLPGTFSRQNLYYTDALPGQVGFDAGLITEFALKNERHRVWPKRVVVSAEVIPQRRTARIADFWLIDEAQYKRLAVRGGWRVEAVPEDLRFLAESGGRVKVRRGMKLYGLVKLLPWRGDPFYAVQPLIFPKRARPGNYRLEAFSGAMAVPVGVKPAEEQARVPTVRRKITQFVTEPPKSLEEELRLISELPTNDELVFRLIYEQEERQAQLENQPPSYYERGRKTGYALEGERTIWLEIIPTV